MPGSLKTDRQITARQTQFLLDEFNTYIGLDPDNVEEINSLKEEVSKNEALSNNEWVKRFMDELSAFKDRSQNNLTKEERQLNPRGHMVNNPKDMANLMFFFYQADKEMQLGDKCPNLKKFLLDRTPAMETFFYLRPKGKDEILDFFDSDDSIEIQEFGYVAISDRMSEDVIDTYKPKGSGRIYPTDVFVRFSESLEYNCQNKNVRSEALEKYIVRNTMNPEGMVDDFTTRMKAAWDKMPKTAWWHKKAAPESDFGQMQTAYDDLLKNMDSIKISRYKDVDFAALKEKIETLKDKSMAYIDAKDAQKKVDNTLTKEERMNRNAGARTKFGQDRYNAAWALNEFCEKSLSELNQKMFQNEAFMNAAKELEQVQRQEKAEKEYWEKDFEKREADFQKDENKARDFRLTVREIEHKASNFGRTDLRIPRATALRTRYTKQMREEVDKKVKEYVDEAVKQDNSVKYYEEKMQHAQKQYDELQQKLELYEGNQGTYGQKTIDITNEGMRNLSTEINRLDNELRKSKSEAASKARTEYMKSREYKKLVSKLEENGKQQFWKDNKKDFSSFSEAESYYHYVIGPAVIKDRNRYYDDQKDMEKLNENCHKIRSSMPPFRDFGAERKKEIKAVKKADKELISAIKGATNKGVSKARRIKITEVKQKDHVM